MELREGREYYSNKLNVTMNLWKIEEKFKWQTIDKNLPIDGEYWYSNREEIFIENEYLLMDQSIMELNIYSFKIDQELIDYLELKEI